MKLDLSQTLYHEDGGLKRHLSDEEIKEVYAPLIKAEHEKEYLRLLGEETRAILKNSNLDLTFRGDIHNIVRMFFPKSKIYTFNTANQIRVLIERNQEMSKWQQFTLVFKMRMEFLRRCFKAKLFVIHHFAFGKYIDNFEKSWADALN